jgi:Plasmid Fertility inhibition factor
MMVIFSVPLADKKPVFMCNYTTPYENENRAVVIVDAKKFLVLWRETPGGLQRNIAHGNPEIWRHDERFIDATDGFSYGFKNPVPLAWVSYVDGEFTSVSYKFWRFGKQIQTHHKRYVAFINGIARTIWLLSHGCEAFPVECKKPVAVKFHAAAGIAGTRVFTMRDVVEDPERVYLSSLSGKSVE